MIKEALYLSVQGRVLTTESGRAPNKTRQWKTVPTLMTASEPCSPSQLLGQDCKWRQKRGGGQAGYGLHPRDHASQITLALARTTRLGTASRHRDERRRRPNVASKDDSVAEVKAATGGIVRRYEVSPRQTGVNAGRQPETMTGL